MPQCIRSGIFKKVEQVEMAVITPYYSLSLIIIIIILTPHSLQYEKVKNNLKILS